MDGTAPETGDPAILAVLRETVGPHAVVTEGDRLVRHASDWSGVAGRPPPAVLRPRTINEVRTILAIANEHRQPLAVQGGLTGLCGGASVREGELALSLDRLDRIVAVDDGSITVEAGATVAATQQAAGHVDAELGIDFGARGTATIGGAIATNAGGLRVIETGMTRAQVLGLEVVLADGRILSELTAMVKVNSGFDLKQLFIGSEGVLGVVTRACLALRPLRAGLATALLSLADADAVLTALASARRAFGPDLCAFEAMWPDYVQTMTERTPFSLPLAGALLALVEVRGATPEDAQARMAAFMEHAVGEGWLRDAVLAQSGAQGKALWALRDEGPALYDQLFAERVTFDVSVPLARVPETAEALAAPLRGRPGIHPLVYGHVGDQNLHFVVGADAPLRPGEAHAIEERVYRTIAGFGGAISAEHGIGVMKKPFLGLTRGPVAVDLMRTLKRALDPHEILNRGRVFDLHSM